MWLSRKLALLGCCGFLGMGMQGQEALSRAHQLTRLHDLLGTWEVSGKILGPPEVAGEAFKGQVTVGWTLGKTTLDIQAKSLFPNTKKALEASGLLTYNDADFYEKRGFTGNFAWSEDGRMLPLKGNFVGDALVLTGKPMGGDQGELKVKISGGPDSKTINVFAVSGKSELPFLTLVLKRLK